jgi:photosystem II stability/assembly factor-like uncharacterized protein
VFACGNRGGHDELKWFDGSSWHVLASGVFPLSVWGASSTDVFGTVGPRIFHLKDGEMTWEEMGKAWYTAIWGATSEDVFAVGDSGNVLHFDGLQWSPMRTWTNKNLHAVWGSSGKDVFAVGERGVILRYNGRNWRAIKSGTRENLNAVWGFGPEDVYAVGSRGSIFHFDGRAGRSIRVSADSLFEASRRTGSIVLAKRPHIPVGEGGSMAAFISHLVNRMDQGVDELIQMVNDSLDPRNWGKDKKDDRIPPIQYQVADHNHREFFARVFRAKSG